MPTWNTRLYLPGGFDHHPPFVGGQRQRLLAVDILPGLAGEDCGQGVPVVGGGDDHCIHVLAVEDSAEVMDGFGTVLPADCLGSGATYVAHCHDLAAFGHRLQKLLTPSADPDEAKIYPVVSSWAVGLAEDLGGNYGGYRQGCCCREKAATGDGGHWVAS